MAKKIDWVNFIYDDVSQEQLDALEAKDFCFWVGEFDPELNSCIVQLTHKTYRDTFNHFCDHHIGDLTVMFKKAGLKCFGEEAESSYAIEGTEEYVKEKLLAAGAEYWEWELDEENQDCP